MHTYSTLQAGQTTIEQFDQTYCKPCIEVSDFPILDYIQPNMLAPEKRKTLGLGEWDTFDIWIRTCYVNKCLSDMPWRWSHVQVSTRCIPGCGTKLHSPQLQVDPTTALLLLFMKCQRGTWVVKSG